MDKALLYYSDKNIVDGYQVRLQLQRKQVKLRDANRFSESNHEFAHEAFIAPEVGDGIRNRIIEHFSETMPVFNIEDDEIDLDENTETETTEAPQEDVDFFDEQETKQADADEKKRLADEAAAKAEKERSEAEAAKLKAQAEELEADQAEKEAEEAKQEVEDAEGELTRLDMISELRELEVTIPRNATKAQVQELYNERVLNADDRT